MDEQRVDFAQMMDLEEQILSEYQERYKPHEYRKVFYPPASGEWEIDALFADSYFESARIIVRGIVVGSLLEAVAGPSACFLCRHYLELALKYTLFHSRWLTDEAQNAPDDKVQPVGKRHGLLCLWRELDGELRRRMPSVFKTGIDLGYVGQFVKEFDTVDGNGARFRYRGKGIAVGSGARPRTEALGIDFGALLYGLTLAHDVLGTVDAYLVDRYGQNEDWEEEVSSW
ncbi:MAG TPA: hypothetical protein VMD75_11860 [Candidatus Binataceae bacterium]|nr:hypothetical protein [Candidatus Binataceae bacterium]